MELTDNEFEELIEAAVKDEAAPSAELNKKLQRKIKNKIRYKKMIKSVPVSAAACIFICFVVTAVGYNSFGGYKMTEKETSADILYKAVNSSQAEAYKTEEIQEKNEEENHTEILKEENQPKASKTHNKKEIKTENPQPKMQESGSSVSVDEYSSELYTAAIANDENNNENDTAETGSGQEIHEASVASLLNEEEAALPDTEDEISEEETANDNESESYSLKSRVSGAGGGGAAAVSGADVKHALTVAEFLEYDSGLFESVYDKISVQMKSMEIEFYENFTQITGREYCYINENGELIVIFEEGSIASAELGKFEFNVGVIK